MSTFESRFNSYRTTRELDTFGDSITYRPKGVSANDATINGVILGESDTQYMDISEPLDYNLLTILVSADDVSSPQVYARHGNSGKGDEFIINGTTWYLMNHLENNVAGLHRFLLSDSPVAGLG